MGKGMVLASILVLCVSFQFNTIDGVTTWIVGDGYGWSPTINIETWPRGKKFYAGDILEFKYDPQLYDVAIVSKEEHDSCTVSPSDPLYESGDDKIALKFGENYFIPSNSDDCQAGMKLAINATARPPLRWRRQSINGYN